MSFSFLEILILVQEMSRHSNYVHQLSKAFSLLRPHQRWKEGGGESCNSPCTPRQGQCTFNSKEA